VIGSVAVLRQNLSFAKTLSLRQMPHIGLI
jgi:hypothetical protein